MPAFPVLAIETSCDETSAAVVDGTRVLSNIVSSQAELHQKWGGVVPEAAARAHVEAILPVIREALGEAGVKLEEVEGIGVTNRPGLIGALSVGVSAAKAIAFSTGKPLIGIHHLEGHILSTLANDSDVIFPHICAVVSGGHTEIVRVGAPGHYEILGQTIDDAAGEAFDKSARVLGLGYPGGKAIQDAAEGGNPNRYALPRGLAGDTLNFSFSGLKTAVLRLVEREGDSLDVRDAAASVQEAITSVLAERATAAAVGLDAQMLTLVGGVAANRLLRHKMQRQCDRAGIRFATPALEMCTDNAAMIGIAASIRLKAGERDGLNLDTYPNSVLPGGVHSGKS